MKKVILNISSLVLFFVLSFSTFSCNKISDNGDLDGMWQFMTVSYAHNGVYDSTINVKDYKSYLSFELSLAKISWINASITDTTKTILCRFAHQGNTLRLYNFYFDFPASDSLIADPNTMLLSPFGIKGNNATFTIQEESNHTLILQNDFAKIFLRKF